MHKLLLFTVLAAACAQNQPPAGGDLESIIKQIFDPPGGQTGSQPAGQTGGQPAGQTGGQPAGQTGGQPGGQTGGQQFAALTPPRVWENPLGPSTIVPPGISDFINDTSCLTEQQERGECVKYYLCNANNSIITDGEGIIDIRLRDGPCPSYMDTCCIPGEVRDSTDPITPPPPPPDQPKREGCGWRNSNGVGFRITGDTDGESKFGEFPWMVAIIKIEPVTPTEPAGQKFFVYVGGGSLIHERIVLTAAHYVASAPTDQLRARAGEWDTQTTKEIYQYQDRSVQKVIIHKDFNKGNLFYDIGLLILTAPFEMTPNIGVVCLPPPRQTAQPGTRCFASGWGKDLFGKEGRYQVILKKVEVPVVGHYQCQEALRKTRLGGRFMLHTSFMCAGGEPGKDTCKGDGGSPLVCPIEYEENRYVQNGIVAWGIGCGDNGSPGVYVDVANLRDWIDDKVKGEGISITSYSYTF